MVCLNVLMTEKWLEAMCWATLFFLSLCWDVICFHICHVWPAHKWQLFLFIWCNGVSPSLLLSLYVQSLHVYCICWNCSVATTSLWSSTWVAPLPMPWSTWASTRLWRKPSMRSAMHMYLKLISYMMCTRLTCIPYLINVISLNCILIHA